MAAPPARLPSGIASLPAARLGHHPCTQRDPVAFKPRTPAESQVRRMGAGHFRLAKLDSLDALEAGVRDHVHYYNHERIRQLGQQGLSLLQYRLRSTV